MYPRQASDTPEETDLGALMRDVGFQPSRGPKLGEHGVFAATNRPAFSA
jgi:hypothetical protein